MIKEFQGIHRCWSNFFKARQYATYGDGIIVAYNTNEHFFQATKEAKDWQQHLAIARAPTPAIAKWMGSPKGYRMPDGTLFKVNLKEGWDDLKVNIMRIGLKLKLQWNPALCQLLVNTHPQGLQEGNWWRDTFWGVCFRTGKGLNMLGKLWMELREELILAGWKPQI